MTNALLAVLGVIAAALMAALVSSTAGALAEGECWDAETSELNVANLKEIGCEFAPEVHAKARRWNNWPSGTWPCVWPCVQTGFLEYSEAEFAGWSAILSIVAAAEFGYEGSVEVVPCRANRDRRYDWKDTEMADLVDCLPGARGYFSRPDRLEVAIYTSDAPGSISFERGWNWFEYPLYTVLHEMAHLLSFHVTGDAHKIGCEESIAHDRDFYAKLDALWGIFLNDSLNAEYLRWGHFADSGDCR